MKNPLNRSDIGAAEVLGVAMTSFVVGMFVNAVSWRIDEHKLQQESLPLLILSLLFMPWLFYVGLIVQAMRRK